MALISPHTLFDHVLNNSFIANVTNDPPADIFLDKPRHKYSFESFMQKKGCEFEKKIYEHLCEKFQHKVFDCTKSTDKEDDTIDAMERSVPIIYNGYLKVKIKKLFGIDSSGYVHGYPDFLIRSDYMNKIFGYEYDDSRLSSKFCSKFHYVVVDAKYKTITHMKDGAHIRNEQLIKFYKIQVVMYLMMLNSIQQTKNDRGFLLCRKYKHKKDTELNCFYNLGLIEKYEILPDGKTVRDVIIDNINKMCMPNCYDSDEEPNMKFQGYDFPLGSYKRKRAEEIDCVSRGYFVGSGDVERLRGKKLSDCVGKDFDIPNEKRRRMLDKMIHMKKKDISFEIKKNIPVLQRLKEDELKFFLDVETINDCVTENFSSFPYACDLNLVTLFGVIVSYKNYEKYYQFHINELTEFEEKRIFESFLNLIKKYSEKFDKKTYCIVHYCSAEETCIKKIVNKYHLNPLGKNVETFLSTYCIDIKKILYDEEITLPQIYGFGLKPYAKYLSSHGIIKSDWADSDIDGKNSMIYTYQALKEKNEDIITKICLYNYYDCKTMLEISKLLN
jgi:hypothetical protein